MKNIEIADIVDLIPEQGTIVLSHAVATHRSFIEALIQYADKFRKLEIIHMVPVEDALYCQQEVQENFFHNALFVGKTTKNAIRDGRAVYTPIFFSEVPRYLKLKTIDVFIATVSRTLNNTVSLGVSVDYGYTAMKNARCVVGIQNEQMPYTIGDGEFSLEAFDYIAKNNIELSTIKSQSDNGVYSRIATHITPLIEDGSTLQLGIGNLPDAVLRKLSNRNDLGLHSEMISSGILPLLKNGNITNASKTYCPNKSVVSFAMGNKELYDYLDMNANILFQRVEKVNNPYVIGQNKNVISINSALEVDFHGQVNAEMLNGVQVSGVGGQVDFVRGARISQGGKSIIAFPSTSSNEKFSRIIPRLGEKSIVTTSRNDVDYICTEFGCVQLSGKSITERKELLISIAHPKFRDLLRGESI